jgi:hypothetical protein
MKYIEEDFAKDLYHDLTQRFASRTLAVSTIEGGGVHWLCTVEYDCNICSIDCFDKFGSAEYFTSFKRDSQIIAMGRTSSKIETINAVDEWMNGCELVYLYERFSFVDQYKRSLMVIYDDLVANSLELSKLAKLKHCLGDSYELWFEHDARRVCINVDEDQEIIHAVFHWDRGIMFNIKTQDRKCLAEVLKRWVYDCALPSAIRTEFPWIEIDKLADFYERGNPIEGEFIKSWDSIERFYEGNRIYYGDELTSRMLELVNSIRAEGYDRHLHAGQAHYQLILSRSQDRRCYLCCLGKYESYQVNGEQKTIQGLKVSYYVNGKLSEEFEEDEIALNSKIRKILQQLLEQPMN